MQIAGRVAIVTGGAQGLGKGFTQALLGRGAKVCMIDVNLKQGETTLTELSTIHGKENVSFNQCDVRNNQGLTDIFHRIKKKYGRLDIVVNNAGIAQEKDWERCIDVNLKGVISGTLLGLHLMSKNEGGSGGVIVNVASTAGLMPVFFFPAYTASKHGVVSYTRSWAEHPDVLKSGVRLTCLCPAFTDTAIIEMNEDAAVGLKHAQKTIEYLGIQTVEDVVEGFLKLIDDEDNNGAVLTVVKGEGPRYKHYRRSNL